MRAILIGAIGLAMVGLPSMSRAADTSCSAALQDLGARWDAMGFSAPAKPSQALVVGRGGYTISGMDYQRMQSEMRQAASACAAGNDPPQLGDIQAMLSKIAGQRKG